MGCRKTFAAIRAAADRSYLAIVLENLKRRRGTNGYMVSVKDVLNKRFQVHGENCRFSRPGHSFFKW
jgi:hypothetical protein